MEFCSFPLLEVIPVDVGVFIELGKPLSDNLGIGESLQRLVLCTEYILPIAIRMPVFVHNPVSTLVLVSPFCPGYEHIIDDIIQFAEDSGRDRVVMILCPSSDNWIEYSYQSVLVPGFGFMYDLANLPDNFMLGAFGWFYKKRVLILSKVPSQEVIPLRNVCHKSLFLGEC